MKARLSALPFGACVLAAAMGETARAIPAHVKCSAPLEVIVYDETSSKWKVSIGTMGWQATLS